MHEMGIASSILEAFQKELLMYPGYRAAKVGVLIGEFAGVDGESLRFCFEAIVMGSSMESLDLGIENGNGDELDVRRIEFEPVEREEVCA